MVKICRLLELEWEVVIRHSYRETNQYANALANFVHSLGSYIVYYESCPT